MCIVYKCHAIHPQSHIHMWCAAQVLLAHSEGEVQPIFVMYHCLDCLWGKHRKGLLPLPLTDRHRVCKSLMCLQLGRQAAAALSAVNYTVLICSDIKLVFPSPSYFLTQSRDGYGYCRKLR